MTKQRKIDLDAPFCAWMREQKQLDSVNFGFSFSDIDVIMHRYESNDGGIVDKAIQGFMQVEIKTGTTEPDTRRDYAQFDSFWKLNAFSGTRLFKGKNGVECVRHFGVFFLCMSGTDPKNSREMKWFSFSGNEVQTRPELNGKTITEAQLVALARFEMDPFTLEPKSFGWWAEPW